MQVNLASFDTMMNAIDINVVFTSKNAYHIDKPDSAATQCI